MSGCGDVRITSPNGTVSVSLAHDYGLDINPLNTVVSLVSTPSALAVLCNAIRTCASPTVEQNDAYGAAVVTGPTAALQLATDRYKSTIVDATANAIAITTPSHINAVEGTWFKVMRVDSVVANPVTIRRFGTGAVLATLSAANKWVKIRIRGGVWEVADNNIV
jgi:hypothetical protein